MKKKDLFSVLSVFAFSFFVVLIAEYIQLREFSYVFEFLLEKTGVVAFCTFIIFLFVMSMIYVTGSTFAGAAVGGGLIYVLSCVEFYKFEISGSHLVIEDLNFIFNMGEISGFAEIVPKVHIFRAFAALMLLLLLIANVRVRLPGNTVRNIAGSVLCLALIVAVVSPTSTLAKGYEFFEFDTQPALTTMGMNERFDSDGFLGFLSQNATEYIDSGISAPEGYSQKQMQKLTVEYNGEESLQSPNIVMILSESFADLREISDDASLIPAYESFDRAADLGSVGVCEVPTFGGYTVRSEFELLFGLPVMSMSNVASPHSLLDAEKPQNTIVRLLSENGYNTCYIHPFDETFYNRSEVYSLYGFDKMIFDAEFDLSQDMYRRYVSDRAVFQKVKDQLCASDESSFVFAMTMQNHQPYIEEGGSINGELEYYLEGVSESSDALYEFLMWLESFDEDTVVLFVGDHFPFFTPQGAVYERLGNGREYSAEVYRQKYILYANFSKLEAFDGTVSLFYLPHMILDKTGAVKTDFTKTVLAEMINTPRYGIASFSGRRNKRLDALTYDRTLGECYVK